MMALYDRYRKLLYSIIFRAVRDTAMAEDLTQETFLRVWNRIGTFNEEKGNFEGWLVTVARNRAFDYLRACAIHRKPQRQKRVTSSVQHGFPPVKRLLTALQTRKQ